MKLNYKTIPDFLKAPAKTSVGALIYGPDGGGVRERTQEMIHTLLGATPDPFALCEITDAQLKENPTRLNEELCAISLLGGNRVIVARDISDKQASLVEQAVPFAGAENYLIVTGGDMGPKDALRYLFEQHKQLAALPCYKEEGAALAVSIRRTLEGYGFSVPREVVDYLAMALGNDRYVTNSELEKIALYAHGEKTLSLEIVRPLVNDNQDHDVDDVCSAYASGELLAFERHWQSLIRSGVQPIVLLRAMQRHYHKLHSMKSQIEASGMSIDAALDACRPPIFFKEKPRMKNQLQRATLAEFTATLKVLMEAELACKTTALPPALVAAEHLLIHSQQGRRYA